MPSSLLAKAHEKFLSFTSDFYAMLGVPRNASNPEIKKAFRNLQIDPEHADYTAICLAYKTLSNKALRADYDNYFDSIFAAHDLIRAKYKYIYYLADAKYSALITHAVLLGSSSILPTVAFAAVLVRDLYVNAGKFDYIFADKDRMLDAIDASISLSLLNCLGYLDQLVCEGPQAKCENGTLVKDRLLNTTVGKTYQALRNATLDDVREAPQKLQSSASEFVEASKNYVTNTFPATWNSLAPAARSLLPFGLTCLCTFAHDGDPATENTVLLIALSISGVDYAVRKFSENTHSLFSAVKNGASLLGKTVDALMNDHGDPALRYVSQGRFCIY